ncbi:isoleucine N-monooxygenase 1-like [Impatiens glandulifera]|uniref:isoleucine N-monooxygenase 1-like n=1 Tax=Impatiens glandulifera TaxID=253017 RepID=UPI001FB12BB7|nr:isoleucine N-monooxygenase 1-like [Impatiens glandulifera]
MSKMGYEIFCIRLGRLHVIVVSSPEIACEFLKKQDAIFASRPTFLSAELLSNGFSMMIFPTNGDQWKKMRRLLVYHILSPDTLKRAEGTDHLIHYVYNVIKSNDGAVNIRIAAQHFCANMMRNMIFSKRFFGKGTENGGPGIEEEEHMAGIFNILKSLYNFCISDYFPFLQHRIDLDGNEKFMRQAVESEMMVEAIDNPSNAIEWAIGEMINQPETLVKAVQELDRVVGKNRLVQESDLNNLNYIKACVKESFRLHPIAAFNVPHVSMCDTIVAGYFIPKGSHVLLSSLGLGRNFKIWDEPLRFNPERHLKHDGSNVILSYPDLHLLSFSIGRRGCPAVNLGSTMSVMLLVYVLSFYD